MSKKSPYTEIIACIPSRELALIELVYLVAKGQLHRSLPEPARCFALHLANIQLLRQRRPLLRGPEAKRCDASLINLIAQTSLLADQLPEELVCFIGVEVAKVETSQL